MKINLLQKQKSPRLVLSKIKPIVRDILTLQPLPLSELSITFVDDALMGSLHLEFLGDPEPTDVLTFPLGTLGEIVISTDTCQRQARVYKTDFQRELMLYVVHGILHLSGFDDHTSADTRRMRIREKAIMGRLKSFDFLRKK